MATRPSRRRKISIPDETNSQPELSSQTVMATGKRNTRRHKENEQNMVGKFVKYPQESPIKNQPGSEVEPKSTRKTRGALTDNNTFSSGQDPDENKEHPEKLARNTRSNRKNASVNVINWENVGKNEPETAGSPKTKKKSRNNKRKALQRSDAIDSVLESLLDVKCESMDTGENSADINNTRKSRRKEKLKNQAFATELYFSPKGTEDSSAGNDKTAGSFNEVYPLKCQERSLTNTSTESFHSAAGSPAHGGLTPEHMEAFQQPDYKTLDTTYEKKTKQDMNSTVTMTTGTAVVMNGTFDKKSTQKKSRKKPSYSNNKITIQKSSTPNLTVLSPEHMETSQQPEDKTLDTTYEKKAKKDMNSTVTITTDTSVGMNGTFDKKSSPNSSPRRPSDSNKRLSVQKSSTPNLTTEEHAQKTITALANESSTKCNTTYDKSPERRSFRISNQNEKGKISEDIFNTTVVLIDSSVDTTKSPIRASTDSLYSKRMQSASPAKRLVCNIETVPNKQQSPEVCLMSHNNQNASKIEIITPKLNREGTFTKERPQVLFESVSPSKVLPSADGSTAKILTPVKTKSSLNAPGSTPYHSKRKNTRSMEKFQSVLNVTRSIEKVKYELRRSSSMATVRPPKVMFCSPVWNEMRDKDCKSRIIKSSLKGSNKSFVLEEPVVPTSSSRKRSYTHSDAEDITAKRKKLTGDDLVNSVKRLSRSKATSSQAKLNQPASKEPVTPTRAKTLTPLRSKSETKPSSVGSKLPDFAALHRKAFERMESLSECQARKAQRARQILHFPPTGVYTLDGRRSPKVSSVPVLKAMPEKPMETKPGPVSKPRAPLSKAASEIAEKPNKSYTRFGFKLPTDINPFSIPSTKTAATKITSNAPQKINTTISHMPKPNSTIVQAKLNGTVPSLRREKSKQMMTREKSATVVTEKRKRENRDILKGVRTNRRFELQMKSRSMNT